MNVIDIQQLKLTMGVRDLLDLKNLQVHEGQRIGLIGKNGSGKSTLFNILNQQEKADINQFSVIGRLTLLPQLKRTDTVKSGGEITQDYIIEALEQSPNILLADEPTTNLDASHVEWVERKLNEFPGTLLLVSHDRALLDNVCDTIWELNEGVITVYNGNYTAFLEQKENEKKYQQKEYEKYQAKKRQLEKAINSKQTQADRAGKSQKKLTASEARDASGVNPYYQTTQKGLHQNRKALETRLEKLDAVEKPVAETPIQMDLPNERAFINKTVVKAEKMKGQVGAKKLWDPTTFFINGGDKIGIIGPNGSGKTTLIKKIIEQSDPALYVSPGIKIGYFAQDLDVLDTEQTILENVTAGARQKEAVIRTILAQLGFYREAVHKKVEVLSGGERVKVSLAKILVSEINTLILDEPTNYLDVYALEALEGLLKDYGGTLLFVSHDRHFISEISSKILAFEDEKLVLFTGTYEEYLNRAQDEYRDTTAEELTKVELNITNILSNLGERGLSDAEKTELEAEFQRLLAKKRRLTKEA